MTSKQLALFRQRVETNLQHWMEQVNVPVTDVGSAVAHARATAKLEAYRDVVAIFDHVAAGSPCRSPNGRTDCHMGFVKMVGGKIVCAFCGKGDPPKRRASNKALARGPAAGETTDGGGKD